MTYELQLLVDIITQDYCPGTYESCQHCRIRFQCDGLTSKQITQVAKTLLLEYPPEEYMEYLL